ncbi:MAG: 50S ribosomal protein L25, partial [Opitutales bacterium]
MKQLNLKVSARESIGSTASKRLRSGGVIPAVLYGPNGTRQLSVDTSEFRKLWKMVAGRTAVIELVEEGAEPAISIIQELQRNPRTDAFVHVDFKEILRGHEMWATVTVHVTGDPYGVRNEGAVLEIHRHDVEIRCLPRHLPEFIEVDVTEMKTDDVLKVK